MKSPTSLTHKTNGLILRFIFSKDEPVKVLDGASASPPKESSGPLLKWARLVELQVSGFDQDDHHGNKYTGTLPGGLLRYAGHTRTRNGLGTKLEICQTGGGLEVTSHLQFFPKLPAFRSWTVVKNTGKQPVLIEYVSTFSLSGLSREGTLPWPDKMQLHVPDNTWCGESQWRSGPLRDFGLSATYHAHQGMGFSMNRVSVSSQGTWSTQGHLPMGALENLEASKTYFWQIEHNGSWHWEVSDIAGELYVQLSGPTYREGLWSRNLCPGEIWQSVPATFGRTDGDLQSALRVLTQARRLIRRPHPDMETLPVIFNDYMNCLMGDPTTEKLVPVVTAAAAAGAEYFVVDAGWYAEEGRSWWDTVGEWQPSAMRFPGGLNQVVDLIRANGMIPGLWLEIEVMGVNCPLARTVPKNWFFQRHGSRVIDHGRFQLDFRNPEVRAHADQIVERLVRNFGIGYVKMDYNINAGPGTDIQADSPGEGLLEHNRSYLAWIEEVFRRHPTLVIENCSSGGLRMDYAQLSVHSIQSTSDQTDYRLNGIIAAASASAVTPEQAAVWSYPLKKGTDEETIFNMVNVLLLRVHQSGRLHEISASRRGLVHEAIALYKEIRPDIPGGLPFWPLGLPRFGAGWTAFGLDCESASYLAVWRLSGNNSCQAIPLKQWEGKRSAIRCLYPQNSPWAVNWSAAKGIVEITLAQKNTARLFLVEPT